jgi:cellulose synthase/poly-beta-1,6-N-acetylglucosamine synthase-like glycosyltransferase
MSFLKVVFWIAWTSIVYAYIVFPLLLAFCARVFGRNAPRAGELADGDLPPVTMVVAAYNEGANIPAKLANTWQLDYPPDRLTLVVGSDGSHDRTAEILEACKDARLQHHCFPQRRGKISVLNDLMRTVKSEIVVMSDANTMFQRDALRKLAQGFQDARVGCVSGELTLEQDGGVSGEGLYWKYEGWIKRNESRLGFLIGCNGGIFALRRELYTPLPASTVVEDFVLTMRVIEQGYQVRFEPEARATEPACPTSRAEMVRKVRIAAGGFQALGLTGGLLHPRYGFCAFAFWGHKVLRWLVPLFLLVALGTNIGLASLPLYRLILMAQIGGILTALWAYRAKPGSRLPRWTRPISYFYLMNFALLSGFCRFITRTQKVTWERAATSIASPSE